MWVPALILGTIFVISNVPKGSAEYPRGNFLDADLEALGAVEDTIFKTVEVVANAGHEIRGCSVQVILGEPGRNRRSESELILDKLSTRIMDKAIYRRSQPVAVLKLGKPEQKEEHEHMEPYYHELKNITEVEFKKWPSAAARSCRLHVILTDADENLREFFAWDWVNNQQDFAIIVAVNKDGIAKKAFTKPLNIIVLRPQTTFRWGKRATQVRELGIDPSTQEHEEIALLDENALNQVLHRERTPSRTDSAMCSSEESSRSSNGNNSMPLMDCDKARERDESTDLEQILIKPLGFFLDPNDLNGKDIKVAYMPASPHVSGVEHLEVGSTVSPTAPGQCECGFEYIMLKTASEKLNFTFSLLKPKDGSWGSFDRENRSWTGMIGMLARGEADIAISANVRVGGATDVIDYSPVFRESSSTFLSVKPGTVSPWQWVLTPFDWQVWILLGGSFAVASYIFWRVDVWINLSKKPEIRKPDPQLTFFCHIGSLELDRFTDRPGSWSNFPRVWFSSWGLAMQVIALTYSSLLIVFLAFPPIKPPLNSLEELAASDFFVLLRAGSTQGILFEGAQDYASKKIMEKLAVQPKKITQVSSAREGIYRVLTEDRTAFIFDYSQLEAELNTRLTPAQKDKVNIAKDRFFTDYYLWPIRQRAPWKNHIEEIINRMFESGLIRFWARPSFEQFYANSRERRLRQSMVAVTPGPTPTTDSPSLDTNGDDSGDNDLADSSIHGNQQQAEALKLAHFQGAFLLLALGYILAVIALADELCVSVRRKDEIKKQRRITKLNALREKRRMLLPSSAISRKQ